MTRRSGQRSSSRAPSRSSWRSGRRGASSPRHCLPASSASSRARGGRLVLAAADADRSPQLVQAFQAQAIPTVVAVVAGQPVPLFAGVQPDDVIDQVFDQLLELAAQHGVTGSVEPGEPGEPTEGTAGEPAEEPLPPLHQEAYDAIERGDFEAAASAYRTAIAQDPRDTARGRRARPGEPPRPPARQDARLHPQRRSGSPARPRRAARRRRPRPLGRSRRRRVRSAAHAVPDARRRRASGECASASSSSSRSSATTTRGSSPRGAASPTCSTEPLGTTRRPRTGHASSVNHTAASGGSVNDADAGRPPHGASLACTPPRLPTPEPPNSAASVFSTSRQRPADGRPSRNPSCGLPAKLTTHEQRPAVAVERRNAMTFSAGRAALDPLEARRSLSSSQSGGRRAVDPVEGADELGELRGATAGRGSTSRARAPRSTRRAGRTPAP